MTRKRYHLTQQVQRYDDVNDFSELFPFVLKTLNAIFKWNITAKSFILFKNSTENTTLFISMSVIKVFGTTIILTRYLNVHFYI